MVKSNVKSILCKALSQKFPPAKVEEILFHYEVLTRSYRLRQYETSLVNGGKFVEAVLKCLYYQRTGQEADRINAETEISQLANNSELNESERLLIPRVLRTIYDKRNRRGGAHNNSFNPNAMDAKNVLENARWVLEELIRLHYLSDPVAVQVAIENLLEKDIPLVEEFDGDYLVLHPELSARIQLEILLYQHHQRRCRFKDLGFWLRHAHSEHNVRVTLTNMRAKALVHENDEGWILTESGIREAETEIVRLLNSPAVKVEARKPAQKRGKNGRK
jgi:hypothetical protein